MLGEAHYASGELASAYEAYTVAAELSPRNTEIQDRYASIKREYEEVTLPPEYAEIELADRLTREQFAALLYNELRTAFDETSSESSVIATDIADSWAEGFILRVADAGVLEVFPNHMFQPKGFVRRVELANSLAAAFALVSPDAYEDARASAQSGESFPDLSAQNISYEAAAIAVSLGLLEPNDTGEFEPRGFVTGAEAAAAVRSLAVQLASSPPAP